jgi:hypothetical protein
MPQIQHVSAVGRVPPCETTKLLSLRHLSLAKFIPLHCTYSYSHRAQPTTLSSQELSSRNAECINNQQTFICLPFNVMAPAGPALRIRCREAGHYACLWGLKEAVPPSRLGMVRNSQNSVSLLAFERVLFPHPPSLHCPPSSPKSNKQISPSLLHTFICVTASTNRYD